MNVKCKNCKWGRPSVKWTYSERTKLQVLMGVPNLVGKRNVIKCNRVPESVEKELDDFCSFFENT